MQVKLLHNISLHQLPLAHIHFAQLRFFLNPPYLKLTTTLEHIDSACG